MFNNLLSAEKILECLLENLDEGIQIVDVDRRTIHYNKAMGKIEGINPEKVIKYLEDIEEDLSTLMNVLKTGEKL